MADGLHDVGAAVSDDATGTGATSDAAPTVASPAADAPAQSAVQPVTGAVVAPQPVPAVAVTAPPSPAPEVAGQQPVPEAAAAPSAPAPTPTADTTPTADVTATAEPATAPQDAPAPLFAPPSSYRRTDDGTSTARPVGAPFPATGHAPAPQGGPVPPGGVVPFGGAAVGGHLPGGARGGVLGAPPAAPPGYGLAGAGAPPGYGPAGAGAPPGYGPDGVGAPSGHGPAVVPPVATAPASRRRRRRSLSVAWVAPLVALALAAGYVGGVLGGRPEPDDGRRVDAGLPAPVVQDAPLDRAPGSIAGIAAGVLPSVVSIEVTTAEGSGSGSGFVLRQDGYVLTNNHVVAGAADGEMVVQFADGTELPGTVVGATGDYDLAVVKVEATGLTPLALGDSDAVVVGDPVVAIGAPLGLVGTVTTGIVSALNRPVVAGEADDTAFINAIQTDAAINPGNSGGPLVNARGEVVGINSAIAQLPGRATSSGSIGLGFAIPSNQARRTAEQLIETGRATYPVIGVVLDPEYSGEGVRVTTEDTDEAEAVRADGPADRAGIRRGDVILSIDGRPVTASEELIVAIRAREPGDTVVLRVRTGDEERDVRVRLDEQSTD